MCRNLQTRLTHRDFTTDCDSSLMGVYSPSKVHSPSSSWVGHISSVPIAPGFPNPPIPCGAYHLQAGPHGQILGIFILILANLRHPQKNIYPLPASRKVKFYEVFCKRPSFTRSSGLLGFIELSPFSHQC